MAEPPSKRAKTNGHLSYNGETTAAIESSALNCTPAAAYGTTTFGVEQVPPPPHGDTVTAIVNESSDHVVVCFGMLVFPLKGSMGAHRNIRSVATMLEHGPNGQLHVIGSDSIVGLLGPRDDELLQLFQLEGITTEIRLNLVRGVSFDSQSLDKISVTLYGPKHLSANIGYTLQDLKAYLQDPHGATQDLPYWNPHKFFNSSDLRTSNFRHIPECSPAKEEQLSTVDFLEAFTTGGDLEETEGSHFLKTSLKIHQKQALTFMLGREQGWRFKGEKLSMAILIICFRYLNQIDESLHDVPPLEFRGGILADTMGYGKTLEIISLIAYDKSTTEQFQTHWLTEPTTTLIVVPAPILNSWERELRTTTVVLDEAHCIKNPDGATSKAAYDLEAERRWAVSGTPIQNRLLELQSLFRFLRVSPYNDKDAFNHQFIYPWQAGEAAKSVERLKKLLSVIMLRRSDKQSMLPDRTDVKRILRFSEQESGYYDKEKGSALAIIDEVLDADRHGNSYTNALQKINALRIICNNGKRSSNLLQGMERSDNIIETAAWNPSIAQKTLARFPLLGLAVSCYQCGAPLDAARKLPGDVKSIVFSFWTSTLAICEEALDGAGIRCERVDGTVKSREREKIFARFQDENDTKVLLLSLSCGAVGLTLTAASRVYLMEPQWNPAIEEQALARVHRIGQTKEVTTIRFIMEDTIEKVKLHAPISP
ncbi:hypothetical protein PG996_011024 [Apiospora saccharicola]|uniref:Uncharacterized protein n=1 Tax=Apiospora saccharicola TaxID=335842 RepID=A0ABR1UDW0_9PEZI